jgi:hypothetical protein
LLISRWEQLSTTVKQIGFLIGYYVGQMATSIKDSFFKSLDSISEKFKSIFDSIQNFVKGSINNIIGFINSMITSVVGGLNGIIGGLNTVGKVVPGFSAIATVTAPQIPRLATGAVIPPNAQFAAILGDQKAGMNLEGPESMFRRIVREESGNNGGQEITIKFEGTLGALVRELRPYIVKENSRVGVSLVKGMVES